MATTTTDFGAALTAALQGGYIAQLSGGTYTITQPIIININSTTQGIGINGGGATLISQVPARALSPSLSRLEFGSSSTISAGSP